MANSFYDAGKEAMLNGNVDFINDTIKVVLIDEGTDAVDLVNDVNLSDIVGGARIGTSGALASKTVTDGAFDAADTTYSALSGASVESFTFYKDSGVESTSTLLFNVDTNTGLPFTPNGGDLTLSWDDGSLKIFKL